MATSRMKLDIPQPCNERWDEMSPVRNGRHCASCAKTVIDFSLASDDELILFFKQNRSADVCGRLSTTQLNRDLQQVPPPPFLRSYRAKAAAFLLVAQSITMQAFAQHSKKARTTAVPVKKTKPSSKVDGQLVSIEGNGLSHQSFQLYVDGHLAEIVTDSSGHFSIEQPMNRDGMISWKRQEIAEGFIIEDSIAFNDLSKYHPLQVTWQAIMQMDPVVLEVREPEISGGLIAVRYDVPTKRKPFFQRIIPRFGKKK